MDGAHLTQTIDDAEAPFRRLPRALARWSGNVLWRRLRMPVRRARWLRQNLAAVAPYAKAAVPANEGPSLAMGDFSGSSGLSRAAVYELDLLRAADPDVEVIDLAELPGRRAPGTPRPGPEVGTLYLLSPPDSYAALLPAIDPRRIARARRVGLWVWETPIFPEDWRFATEVVHEVWTPSQYSRDAIAPAIAPIPVEVRPHAVTPPDGIEPFDRARHGIPEDAFLGVAIMDLLSCPARKNPWAHVAAWQRAFGDDPAHVLLVKLRVSKRTRVVLGELAEMIGTAGNIRVFEQEMSAAAVAGLQRAGDVYLSLHRAEGYGLNIRECLDAGIDVVATDYSANAEYGPAFDTYHPVPWRPVPYRDWNGHYPDGRFEWAEADVSAAARILQTLAARAAEMPAHAIAAGA